MAKFLLDTNILSYFGDRSSKFHEAVYQRFTSLTEGDELCISILSSYEYEYGIACSPPTIRTKLLQSQKEIINIIPIVPLNEAGSKVFGEIKKQYWEQIGIDRKSLERHNIDFMIASSAIVENATLVSNDSIFKLLQEIGKDFKLENWTV